MTRRNDNFRASNPPPQDFDADLLRIDAMLGDLASRQPAPTGLADRVFRASVAQLPQTAVPQLRLVGTDPLPRQRIALHRTAWARLAMAACVAVAFVFAAQFLHSPGINPVGPVAESTVNGRADTVMYAMNGARTALVVPVAHRAPLSLEEELLLLGPNSAYLVETRDLTYADLSKDLAMLAWDYEG